MVFIPKPDNVTVYVPAILYHGMALAAIDLVNNAGQVGIQLVPGVPEHAYNDKVIVADHGFPTYLNFADIDVG